MRIAVFFFLLLSMSPIHASAVDESTTPIAAGLERVDARTLRGPENFLRGYPAIVAPGMANAVIEVPAGYVDKWEVKNEDGLLHWDLADGKPRRVAYLGYPANYGMVPRTVLSKARGGDGDPLDVLVLGEAIPRGSVVPARVIGLLEMHDRGELDVKLVAVRQETPLGDVRSIEELDRRFPGITRILEIWFSHYKGEGLTQAKGFGDVARALEMLTNASADYEARAGEGTSRDD
jgi:inorganic pyrophosphatase